MNRSAKVFETHRAAMLALAYRMLGELGRAEDVVQEAWLRWQGHAESITSDKAWLATVVTRLCLSELSSARCRREVSRADRLPEPIDLANVGLDSLENLDQISMAFVVLLQRLTPAERATLLLHDVFDFDHAEIGALLHKSEPACRQLLKRARRQVEAERRSLTVSREEHQRLLRSFIAAANCGDIAGLQGILSEGVVLVADAGPEGGSYGRVRNLPRPIAGRDKVAAFVAAAGAQGAAGASVGERELNGQPAIVLSREGRPFAVITLGIADGLVRSVFMHADIGRLGRVSSSPELKKDV